MYTFVVRAGRQVVKENLSSPVVFRLYRCLFRLLLLSMIPALSACSGSFPDTTFSDSNLLNLISSQESPGDLATIETGPGILVQTNGTLYTSEAGFPALFRVSLRTQPVSPVTLAVTTTNPAEGDISTDAVIFQNSLSLLFDDTNWDTPVEIIVRGRDDAVNDGNVIYSIIVSLISTTDPDYLAIAPRSVVVINMDDEMAGINVSPVAGLTLNESGASSASFSVVLAQAPADNVKLCLSSSDTTEAILDITGPVLGPDGDCSVARIEFTPFNWNTAQTVTLLKVDDLIADGNRTFTIHILPAISLDPFFSRLDPPDVLGTTLDDDTADITVIDPGTPGLSISESGQTDFFNMVLTSQPTAPVSINLSVPPSHQEISLDGATWFSSLDVVFTVTDWLLQRNIYVRSVDDTIMDRVAGGPEPSFTLTIAPAVSADSLYSGMDATDLTGTNAENEKFLYVTSATHTGDFDGDGSLAGLYTGAITNDGDGITEADNFCMVDPFYPGGGEFKALIVDDVFRRATKIANNATLPIDWVLQLSTTYYRLDGITKVGTSSNKALFDFGSWSLTNSFDSVPGEYWTGLKAPVDWLSDGDNCNRWSSSSSSDQGTFGMGDVLNDYAISNSAIKQDCNQPMKLLCIEQ